MAVRPKAEVVEPEVSALEERLAWDRYFTKCLSRWELRLAAEYADKALEERRKRFGVSKP
jgi:hypothetical protein